MEENKNNTGSQNTPSSKLEEQMKSVAAEATKYAAKAAMGSAKKAASAKLLIPILIAVGVIILGGVVFAGIKLNWFHNPLSIEKTTNVVGEVKKIGEFTTACYYEEVALQDSYTDSATFMGRDMSKLAAKATRKLGLGFASKFASNTTASVVNKSNEIVLIGKGRVRAGFDLSKVQEGDVNAHGDTLELAVPPAEVFDIIMNPSDFTTEYEKGTWSHELLKPVKERAKIELEQNAIEFGILKKAEENGLKRLEALFKTFGFNTVLLTVAQADETASAAPAAEEAK